MAVCFGTSEILRLKAVTKLGYAQKKLVSVYEDNPSAVYFPRKITDNSNTNHIDVIYHFVRERFATELIKILLNIPTRSNTADILKMTLPAEVQWSHMLSLLVNIYQENKWC